MSSEAAVRSPERSPYLPPHPSCSIGRTGNDVGRVVVWVLGEFDVSAAPELREILEDLAEHRRATLLDLSAATFMDCAGVAVVLRATATAAREGWPFSVADGAPLAVTSLFDLVRVRQPFPTGVGP